MQEFSISQEQLSLLTEKVIPLAFKEALRQAREKGSRFEPGVVVGSARGGLTCVFVRQEGEIAFCVIPAEYSQTGEDEHFQYPIDSLYVMDDVIRIANEMRNKEIAESIAVAMCSRSN